MARRKVVVTDIAWPAPDAEIHLVAEADAELHLAQTGDENELVAMVPDADAIITCWKLVTARVIDAAPKCLVISRTGIGLDNIDIPHATRRGIIVTNVPTYCVEEVSDHTIALILALARKTALYDRTLKRGVYDREVGPAMRRINRLTVGVVGLGNIGRLAARKAKGVGFNVIASDPALSPDDTRTLGVELVPFDELLARADFVTLHVPLNDDTRHMMSADQFRRMKPTACVVNTSRGPLIDEAALARALDDREIAGAGLDVFENEPTSPDSPVVNHPNVVATPHAAFLSIESLTELQETAARHVADVLLGRTPTNIVNPEVLAQPNLRATLH